MNKLEIGEDSLIAPFCYIIDYDHSFSDVKVPISKQGFASKPVSIGSDVWIGVRAVILKGVTIGDGSVIGAGSVVTSDIPPNSIAVGVPARVIERRIKKR